MLGGSVQLAKSTSLYMESAHRNLSRGLNRLSTGVKLSNGVDDAGGLGVSMNIGAKLKKAFKVRENVQNARSFLEQQDAALSSMGKALDRMAELRTKYDDLVAGRPERELYNKEFKEMQSEMLSMRGRKFNGVSIFSTDPKDPMSFYIPTSDDGISTQVTINRTGFFDSLTIGSSTPGSTPATTFNGVTGSFAGSVQGNAGGAITSFPRTPANGLHAAPIDFTITAGGTVTPFPTNPLIGASPAIGITVKAGGTVTDFPTNPLIGTSSAVGITVKAGGTVADFAATPVKGSHTAIPVTVVEGTPTTITATALQGTGSHNENVTAFAGEEISIPTTVTTGGNAAEIPAWTANPVTPNGNMSQQGVTDSSGNLWFVTDDGVVQKVQAGDPAAAGTGVITTIPGLSGAAGDYVSKPIILPVGGQEYMFVAGQNGGGTATVHKIRLSDGNRQEFSALTGGTEKLKGLSEHNGKIYFAFSTTNANSRGGIVRLNTAGGMSRDNSFSGNGRMLLQNGRDFGISGSGAQVEIAFDSADNLYVTADRTEFFGGFAFNQPSLRSFDANGANHYPSRDVGSFNTATGGLAGNTVHSPVVDGANIYITLDSTGFAGANQIQARQTSDGNLNGAFTTINLGSERAIRNPVVNGANLYVSTDQGKVHSYSKTTGAFVATFDSGSASSLTMPVFDGTDFYVGQTNGRIHKVEVAVSGTMTRDATWPAPGVSAAGAIEAPPLVVGTEVYVGSSSRIQGFEAPTPSTTLTNQTNVQKTPGGNDYLSTHSVGDTFNVTVKTGATLTDWTGTATVVDDGGVGKLNITGFSGTTDLTGKLTVNVVSPPITPTLPTSLKIGSNYVTGDTPTVTVNKPGPDNTPGNADDTSENLLSTGATPKVKVITAAMIGTPGFDAALYGAGDLGKLDIDLTGVTPDGTGNYNLTATAGSRYLQATTFNNQGTIGAYPATETPELKSITDSGGVAVTGVTATSGVADVNGQLDIVLAGTPSATGTLTLTFDGPLTATPATTLSNVGTNYAPGEVVLVTTNVPKQGGGTNFLTATATNNNNGTLTISAFNGIPSSSSSTVANAYNVTANPGTIHHLPNENPAADPLTSYGNGEIVGVSLIDTGTGAVPQEAPVPPALIGPDITASGIGQLDGSVIITFSGTPTSPSPITVTVDPGSLTAAPTTPGSLTGIGTGYATGEAVTANVTGVAGMTATATNNNNGTLNIGLGAVPAGTAPGTYQVQANPGATFQLPNENIAANTGSYGNGEVVAVALTDNVTGLAPAGGLAASGTGQGDGSLQITFTNSPTSANPIQVAPATGSPSLAQTSLSNVGSGYNPAEPIPTITVTDPGGTDVTGTAAVTGINAADGSLNVDLTGVTLTAASPTGTYTVATSNGTIASIPTALNGIGSGYSLGEPAPVVTVTDPASASLAGATASINPNGTLSVNLAGVAATVAGTYTVNATAGAGSGMQQGLDDTGKDLWDFSHADFKNFIQTLTNVRAVNGATTSSLAFSESRLETNIQNLELAGGRIVDADMAEEMVAVAKSQILLQTATDSLTKHNRLSVDVDRTLMGLSGGM